MPVATITSKGQTTIPVEVRRHLNLKPGDKIAFNIEDGRVVLRARNRSIMELAGVLKRAGEKAMTIGEMNEAVIEAVLAKDARSRQ
jgi:antitoxin PrlF